MNEPEFVAAVIGAAVRAEATTDVIVQYLDVAGVPIELRYASTGLREVLGAALEHLEVSGPRAGGAIIRLWDTVSTGVTAPPPPVSHEQFTDRGDLLGMNDPAYRTAFHWSEYSVCVFDVAAQVGAYWVADPANLPYWSRSSPLRTMLGWVLEEHGVQLVHAAAVATDEGAVLIAGSGGTGKSTTSLTCIEAGLYFLGDDYVAVSAHPATVHSVFATAKIADTQHPAARRFPLMPSSEGDEKAVLQLYPTAGSQLKTSMPLRAVVSPIVVDSETTDVIEIDRDVLEHAATFTTLMQLPHAGARARARIGAILDELPGGQLRLGRDPAGVVAAIRELIAHPTVSTSLSDSGDLPSVTVIIPVHNGAHFLRAAVDSLLAQRYPHLEIVVVDDGSEDDLGAAIAALPVDVRFHHQAAAGPAAARNTGIELSSSDLVAFLDVDDVWPPGSLFTLVRDWMTGGAAVVIGETQMVALDQDSGEEQPLGTPESAFPFYIGSAIYDRTAFDTIGLFDPDMLYGEDTDWFTRLDESGLTLRRINAITLVVRRHGANMTEGRDLVELYVVRAIKKALDRKRDREREA